MRGSWQSNQRAELQAAIAALRAEDRPIEIRTDSKYVLDGVGVRLARWRRSDWSDVDNGDLWHEMDDLLQARPVGSVLLTKVKGHAKMSEVRSGRIAWEDKSGNDAADVLARRGAFQQRVS